MIDFDDLNLRVLLIHCNGYSDIYEHFEFHAQLC